MCQTFAPQELYRIRYRYGRSVADLITTLSVRYSEALKKRFKLSEIDEDPYKTIECIGRNRGAVLPGNRIDMEKNI